MLSLAEARNRSGCMPLVNFDGIVSEIRRLADARTVLTFHSVGDTDSLASAIAMSLLFRNSVVAAPDRLTGNAARILHKLGYGNGLVSYEFDDSAETVVLLDVNNFEGCGSFREKLEGFDGRILVVDHHRPMEDKENMVILSDESYNSASSIAYEILKRFGANVDGRLAKLIAMGILSDSAEFKNATPLSFGQLGELFAAAKTDYITLTTEMGHVSPAEERIKTVTDVMESHAFVNAGLLFMEGECHGYANLAADSAIKIGADVALFHALGKEVSFSARLRPTLDRKYRIHLGRIMRQLAPIISGTGGGHPCAAGAYGNGGDIERFIRSFIDSIIESTKR